MAGTRTNSNSITAILIEKLNNKGIEYEILHLYLVDENGKYGLVTLEQYNNCPLYDISLERS